MSSARAFYLTDVAPRLAGTPHAAALIGDGSEVLGYDDAISTDHDFGRRVLVFVPGRSGPTRPADMPPDGRVEVSTAEEYFVGRLGVDPAEGLSLTDWLVTPTQTLAVLTGGAVFHDPLGLLAARRSALAWYPEDVWRYVLAAGWLRVDQEQAFVGRAGGRGDDLGSRVVAARVVRDLIRLAFLVQRRWAPYSKWIARAFADLPVAAQVGPPLPAVLAAHQWRQREEALTEAARRLGRPPTRWAWPTRSTRPAPVPHPRHPGGGRGGLHGEPCRGDHRPARTGARRPSRPAAGHRSPARCDRPGGRLDRRARAPGPVPGGRAATGSVSLTPARPG